MTQKEVPHLAPQEVRNLALEGGGGKGFAYLGALQALEELNVMSHIDGISGTSAGAITALLLSTGMTAKEIQEELRVRDFNSFFDPPFERRGERLVPAPFEYESRKDNPCETALLSGNLSSAVNPVDWAKALACLYANDSILARLFGSLGWMYQAQGPVGSFARSVLARIAEEFDLAPVVALLRGLPHYLVYFDRDMGFFSGKAARDYFDFVLRMRAVKQTGDTRFATASPTMPFRVHKQVFGIDLLLCGANLSTGKTVLFSWKHTPNFPVADAVRISMSLPGAYKPYVISQRVPGWPPCGTYIDGGLWNNLPFREIGNLRYVPPRQASMQTSRSSLETALERRNTLGLRLGIDEPSPVIRGGQLLGKVLTSGATAGESQVISDVQPFTIELDVNIEGLGLLVFNPPEATQRIVTPRSRLKTYLYFGLAPVNGAGPPATLETLKAQVEAHDRARQRTEARLCR
jgi:predicted acylesterase/phospholipase RssA